MDVIYEDEALAVVDKPAGLMVHDSRLARGERDFAADRLREQFGRRIFLAHRLDRATSGCLLVCFDRDTAAGIGEQFMTRGVEKHYLAVCRGWPEPAQGVVEHALDGGPGKPGKKPASTRWQRLATAELALPEQVAGFDTARFALLACIPLTGRFRQIRRHLKHLRHPLVGDTSHGDGARNRIFRVQMGVHRMLLHAWRLGFDHPVDGRRIEVAAPLDAGFQRVFDRFGWTLPDAAPAPVPVIGTTAPLG